MTQANVTLTDNTLEAEAQPDQSLVRFAWRGHLFAVDLRNVRFGRMAYAVRIANNDRIPLYSRVNAMLDIFEDLLGPDQVATAYDLAPRLFDDPTEMKSFWDAVNGVVVGGEPGEAPAS